MFPDADDALVNNDGGLLDAVERLASFAVGLSSIDDSFVNRRIVGAFLILLADRVSLKCGGGYAKSDDGHPKNCDGF